MSEVLFKHASWLSESVRGPESFHALVDMCTKLLLPVRHEFDAIAVSGLSGALVGPTVALRMSKYIIAVRKGEDCHSEHDVEGRRDSFCYVVLDDLISSGKTLDHIVKQVGRHTGHQAKFVGVLLYRYNGPMGGHFLDYASLKKCNWLQYISEFGQRETIPPTASSAEQGKLGAVCGKKQSCNSQLNECET